jgi:hypothetical protein
MGAGLSVRMIAGPTPWAGKLSRQFFPEEEERRRERENGKQHGYDKNVKKTPFCFLLFCKKIPKLCGLILRRY